MNCLWGPWNSTWSECSKSCGGGLKSKSRIIVQEAQNFGVNCTGQNITHASCNNNHCPGRN